MELDDVDLWTPKHESAMAAVGDTVSTVVISWTLLLRMQLMSNLSLPKKMYLIKIC